MKKWLVGACDDGAVWAEGKSARIAWETCQRADWMLWALSRIGYDDNKTLRLFACACVRHTPLANGHTVWDLLTDERSRTAVDIGERYANGNASVEELRAAWAAAGAAAGAAWAAARAAAGAWQADLLRTMIPWTTIEPLTRDAQEQRRDAE